VVKLIDPNATGIFCADLKTDKDWRILLTEINVWRFFTTSYFFSKAWCNMPYYHTKLWLWERIEYTGPKFNCIPENRYRVRMVDMWFKLIKDNEWSSDPTYWKK
jgi:carbamoyl-phosphate synthase large subunit